MQTAGLSIVRGSCWLCGQSAFQGAKRLSYLWRCQFVGVVAGWNERREVMVSVGVVDGVGVGASKKNRTGAVVLELWLCGGSACQEAECLSCSVCRVSGCDVVGVALVDGRRAKTEQCCWSVGRQSTTILLITLEVANSKAKSEGIQIYCYK